MTQIFIRNIAWKFSEKTTPKTRRRNILVCFSCGTYKRHHEILTFSGVWVYWKRNNNKNRIKENVNKSTQTVTNVSLFRNFLYTFAIFLALAHLEENSILFELAIFIIIEFLFQKGNCQTRDQLWECLNQNISQNVSIFIIRNINL